MATNSSKAKQRNRKTSDECVDQMHTFPRGGSPSRALPPRRRRDHWRVAGGGQGFSLHLVRKPSLLLLRFECVGITCRFWSREGGVKVYGFWAPSACSAHVSTHGCGSSQGSHLPRAGAAPSARSATSVSLWLEQAILPSHYIGTRGGHCLL